MTWNSDISEIDQHTICILFEDVFAWVNEYAKEGVLLKGNILRIGRSPKGRHDFQRALWIAFYDLLPKLGIEPPAIFGF